jgi:hypothetical protein
MPIHVAAATTESTSDDMFVVGLVFWGFVGAAFLYGLIAEARDKIRARASRNRPYAATSSPRPSTATTHVHPSTNLGTGRTDSGVGAASARADRWSGGSTSSGKRSVAGAAFSAWIASEDGARPANGYSGTSISSGNRSVPGAVFTPWISSEDKLAIARQHNWVCQLCLKPIDRNISYDYESPDPDRLVIDHIKPLRHGGSDAPSNLQPAHHRCNMRKGDRWITNEEFRKWEATRAAQAAPPRRTPLEPKRSTSAASTPRPTVNRKSAQHRAASPPRLYTPRSYREPQFSRPPSHPTVRELLRQLPTAKLSPLMRERAEHFLADNHEMGLLTECQRGHEFTLENTYFRIEDGVIGRQCRACRRLHR